MEQKKHTCKKILGKKQSGRFSPMTICINWTSRLFYSKLYSHFFLFKSGHDLFVRSEEWSFPWMGIFIGACQRTEVFKLFLSMAKLRDYLHTWSLDSWIKPQKRSPFDEKVRQGQELLSNIQTVILERSLRRKLLYE